MNMNGRKKTINIIIIVSIAILCISVAVVGAIYFKNRTTPTYNPSTETTTTTTESATQTTTETTTESTTTSTTESTTKQTTTTTTTKKSTDNFYDSVTYRSPNAKPADINKHGRELMLLNNNYELPENFKWDLVDFKTGKPVNALTLNDYQVTAVDRMAYQPLKDLLAAAEEDGISIYVYSAYRSMQRQDRNFTRSVNNLINQGYSKEKAIATTNTVRAYPGTSEHNAGFGFDIMPKGKVILNESFANTKEFKWLIEHVEEYGFILRYQKDKTAITGFSYEPWHFRYVGVEHAKKINELGYCLEEYIEFLEM